MANEHSVGNELPADCEVIEVRVTDLKQLFNPIDPSPPSEKDLAPGVEEFIVAWARSVKREAGLALQIFVGTMNSPQEASTVGTAVRTFFKQRSLSAGRRLNQLFSVGRTSMLIGLTFLAGAVTLASLVDRAIGTTAVGALIRETLVIGGWVAMWRPLEIFLYDWWPISAERKLYDRLSEMAVRVTFKAQ